MSLRNFIKNNLVYLDGGLGTILQEKGLLNGDLPERLNLTNPSAILDIHKNYFLAGSNVVSTNTFGANLLKYSRSELDKIIKAGVNLVKTAMGEDRKNKFVALDVGPTGKLLKPYGDLDFEDAVSVFKETISLGVKYGVDLIFIETMNDCYETKAAVIAAKECCNLPIFVSNAYGLDGKLMSGTSPSAMVSMLEGLGVDAIGANCSFGPDKLTGVIDELLSVSSTPIILKPNAGMPTVKNGKTLYDIEPIKFSSSILNCIKKGVRIVGGCCGTTPKYIEKLVSATKDLKPLKIEKKNLVAISSYSHAVYFDKPILIGERINPTGKKAFKNALIEGDISYVLNEGIKQQEKGVHVLDVNVGIPDIDEPSMLETAVTKLQAIIDLPLQIDTSSNVALEKALRVYNGKPLINSVSGKKESIEKVFPLVKKYGGLVVCLTLDENGIPETANGRFQIAKNILQSAKKYGISKNNLIFDPLAMTIATNPNSANVTLDAISLITKKLKCKTILGVSNVSFGMPNRNLINSNFFTLCLNAGLTAGIINPFSCEMLSAYYSYLALTNNDGEFSNYTNYASSLSSVETVVATNNALKEDDLTSAIINGLSDKAKSLTQKLLATESSLDVINKYVIPALDKVGKDFEDKKIFLPKMLSSAETAKIAFNVIKENTTAQLNIKCPIVMATVKGDIHDIGKNIVSMLLSNYGFNVIDLGKDVDSKIIVDEAIKNKAIIVGLSALMTTTVESMEETIKELKKRAPNVKVVVGGAVLTESYANKIGADKYCRDALEAVKYANEVFDNLK